MPERPRRKQHLVSRGYQRNFAADIWLTVLDSSSGKTVWRRRSIGANWRVPDFVSIVWPDGEVDDSLEREFGDREQRFLNEVRRVQLNHPVTDIQKSALDELAAVHLVRNVSFALAHDKVVHDSTQEVVNQLAGDEEALARFIRDRRRSPEPGELKALVAAVAEDLVNGPDFFASGVRRVAGSIPRMLRKWRVQLVGSVQGVPGFVLSDNPILHGRRREGRFGFRDGVAIGDADTIVVPISRRLVAFYSSERRPDVEIRTKKGVRWVNSLLLQSARSQVACHPEDALETSRLIRQRDLYPPQRFDNIAFH